MARRSSKRWWVFGLGAALWIAAIGAYIDAVSDDFEAALTDHQDEIRAVAKAHASAVSTDWPGIQTRLQPIVQEHLTPVLSRLMHEALTDARGG